jgi:2,4-dienoyl-CoA reductase-like NADH-dependent reductase (Old Yellow Enzyme family)
VALTKFLLRQPQMTSLLFRPIELRGLTLPNRIVVAPMTQFSADDGVAGNWHLVHLGQFALSGVGLILTESCYVEPTSRNAPSCLSLYNDEQEQAIGVVASFINEFGNGAFGVQLCHAGRKASAKTPAEGGGPKLISEGGYQAVAPSEVPISPDWPTPRALTIEDIKVLMDTFAGAAERVQRSGAGLIELHGAHGYLLHQFMSPISNRRTDQYGGNLENRMRFPLEVFEAVRSAFPTDKPVGIRLSATDWVADGWDVASTVRLSNELKSLGCDYVHISSGGLSPDQSIVDGPGYQTGFAAEVKRNVDIPVITVGQISEPRQAETILQTGQADMVALARPMLFNPRWTWHAAQELGDETFYPHQYRRGHPSRWGSRGANIVGNYAFENQPNKKS